MNKPAKLRSRSPDAADGQMMYSLVRAAHALESRLEEALEQVGLSLAKFGALSHLVKEGEPLSLSECATRMTTARRTTNQPAARRPQGGGRGGGPRGRPRGPPRSEGRRDAAGQGAICRWR